MTDVAKRLGMSDKSLYLWVRLAKGRPGVGKGEKRIARLMRQGQMRSVRGYKRPRFRVGMPATTAPNRLQRAFTLEQPDQVGVTDIIYIRTHEAWLYLSVVIDL